jgi:diadenylate cyclase
MGGFLGEIINFIETTVANIAFTDILDIALVSVIVYIIFKFIRDTRAAQLIKGIILIIVIWQLSNILRLNASYYIINSMLEFGVLAMLIVFTPELRSVLERVGRRGFNKFTLFSTDDDKSKENIDDMIKNIVDATLNLAATKTGALMVIERETKLGEIIKTGTAIDASTSTQLIMNLFYNKAPLHDGAVLFRASRVLAAGCVLPLTNSNLAGDLGTRHRAAIGVTEISDSIVVVVSEETGIISVAMEGKLNRRITSETLTAILQKNLLPDDTKKKDFFSGLWKGKTK